jgi:sialidase-1
MQMMRQNTIACTLAVATIALIALIARPAAAELTQSTLFAAGKDGYHTYRIPALITTTKGTLLAFCEGRKAGRSDAGNIDLLLKRSLDGGKTWQETQTVWDDADNTCGNPCPVIDAKTGVVHLLLTHNYGDDVEQEIATGKGKGSRTVWHTQSADDGVTWSKPVEITRDVKKPDWTWYATGPGVGIQLKSGRLLVPCDNKVIGTRTHQSHVIYSDDGGKTWKLGGIVGPACNECQAVELADGSVMLNIRSYRGDKRRLVAISKDGGETFGELTPDETLIEPVCQASILRHPGKEGGILFANPASSKRENMTVRLSHDEGKTWPLALNLFPGQSAYSCLTVQSDGSIACLYESGEKHYSHGLTFARFTLNDLSSAKAPRE